MFGKKAVSRCRVLLLRKMLDYHAGVRLGLEDKRRDYHQQTFSRRHLKDEAEKQRKVQHKKDCVTLGLPEDCQESGVRDAYIKLAKRYHPDGGTNQADAERFQKVDAAYKNLLKEFVNVRHNRHKIEGEYGLKFKEEEEESPDIKHTAPQHRQYLSFDGIGSGTPFDREKQYNTYRRVKAAENVMDYRVQKISRIDGVKETALAKDQKASKKIKTGIGIERLVEDLIQQSMASGAFDNLSGKGKPLKHSSSYNPYIDFTTHKMNQVLIENGFVPDWIVLEKEIKEEIKKLRKNISNSRHKYDAVLSSADEQEWNDALQKIKPDCETLNKMILRFNLTVPITLNKQMMTFQLDREAKKALSTFSPEIQEQVKIDNIHTKHEKDKRQKPNVSSNSDDTLVGMLLSIFK